MQATLCLVVRVEKSLSEQAHDAEKWNTWQLPSVGEGSAAGSAPVSAPTAGGIEQIERQAYEDGFVRGQQDGLARFGEEVQHRVNALNNILSGLAQPLEQIDDDVANSVATLAITIARQLIRRELSTDPGQIVATVREALSVLPMAARHVQLFLHPDDITLLQDVLTTEESERAWKLVPDATLSRGGCRLDCDQAEVDATIESRITEVAAGILGGQRASDS